MTPREPKRPGKEDGRNGFALQGQVEEIVALVPGFLGFERLGGFGYFADHIAATLRSVLEVGNRRRTPVIPLGTLPAGSLVERQRLLLDQLAFWNSHYKPKRIHLVCHSSGGLDAYFLRDAKTLAGTVWSKEQQEVRQRIASIVTMGAPFLGTTLSDTEVAEFLAGTRMMPPPLRVVASLGVELVHMFKENDAKLERLAALTADLPAAIGVLHQLARHRDLIGDLSPKRMMQRYEQFKPDLEPKLTCFVSYVHPPQQNHASALFMRAYRYTAEGAEGRPGEAELDRNKGLLEGVPLIRSPGAPVPQLSAASSDGIVNTLRQLPPGVRQEDIGGIVIADHADLLGYFDRYDPRTGSERQVSIFRSGATFRDDQFFELFDAVALRLLRHGAASQADETLRGQHANI